MDNSFFWDSSTQTIFCSSQGEQVYSLVKQVDKKSFMTTFPPLFRSVFHDVTLEKKKVFIGVGPGSFTGVKSGIAFIGGWLFSKGKKDINTVSSGDILSCYAPRIAGILAVVIPFNRREWFVSTYRFNDDKYVPLKKDMHLKNDNDFEELNNSFLHDRVWFTSSEKESAEEFMQEFGRENDEFIALAQKPFRIPIKESIINTIDIEKSPLFLNYVLQPAGLSDNTAFYIQTIKEESTMRTDQMDTKKRIEKLRREHKTLHDDVDAFKKKVHLTPNEERDLKMWQKKKLILKDKIAKLEQQ